MADFESWLPWLLMVFTFVTVLMLLWPTQYRRKSSKDGAVTRERRVHILVLGDIGRSPRMQYHALSIAKHGGQVDFIGYTGSCRHYQLACSIAYSRAPESDVHAEVLSSPSITIHPIRPPPGFLQTTNPLMFLVLGPLKVLLQTVILWVILGYKIKPGEWMLVQVS